MSEYQLSWTSFKNNLCNGFSQLQQKEEFVDMTLAADGHLVKVHRNIMSVASPYIKEMLQSTTCRDPVVFLNNVSYHDLSYILEYIYTGEVKVPIHTLSTFINSAKSLHITGIKDLIEPKIPQELSQPLTEISKRCKDEAAAAVETYTYEKSASRTDKNTSELQDLNSQIQSDSNNVYSDSNNLSDPDIIHMDVDNVQSQTTDENKITGTDESETASENIDTVHLDEADKNVNYKASITLNFEDDGFEMIQNDEECGAEVPKFNIQIQSGQRNNGSEDPALSISVNENTQNLESISESLAIVKTEGKIHDASAPIYSVSERGSLQLILNRFIYNMHHSSHGNRKRRWRCSDYRKLNCKAYIDTLCDEIVGRINEHSHGFHDEKILKKGSKQNIYSTLEGADEAAKAEMFGV